MVQGGVWVGPGVGPVVGSSGALGGVPQSRGGVQQSRGGFSRSQDGGGSRCQVLADPERDSASATPSANPSHELH